MTRELVLGALLLAACGGGSASSGGGGTTTAGGGGSGAAQGQSLSDAMNIFCAAPSRVDQHDECDDSTMRATCLDNELPRGITNTDVLALVEQLRASMPTSEKVAKINELATRAGIEHCGTATALSSP